jgi:glycosyltransferase involved in cell wall biosynthesis
MKRVEAHTAISPNLVVWIKERCPNVPVHLLYPGANLDMFSPEIEGTTVDRELGLEDHKVLVYTGTMSLEIFSWFMEVLSQVIKKYPEIVLVLVGEDRFRVAAERLANEKGLTENYYLIGQSPYADIPNYLAAADILLQHSLDQANVLRLPAKLPEYLAMGKPVITFAEGIGESFEDGVHVRKLRSKDPSEAATHVIDILGNPVIQNKLGAAARELACKRFEWSKNSAWLTQIYAQILA